MALDIILSSSSDLRSFFDTDRLNRVKIGDITSYQKIIARGCSQGSSFGSLMSNLFKNDIGRNILNLKKES